MLNSRYYNPEWGRFINADGFISTGRGLLSNNMYAYCNNNPVNMKDKNGTWGIGLISLLFIAVVLVLYTCTIIENNTDTSGGELIQDIADNLPTINLETKTTTTTKTTTETITKTKDKDDEEVYIYRYGYSIEGINKLVPTDIDVDENSGLSFSTIPKPGSAKTTMKAINATGILRAEKDKPTHVGVFPINGTLKDWHNQGADSIWTQALKNIVIQWDGGK